MAYPLENFLRPPVELVSAAMLTTAGVMVAVNPELFLLEGPAAIAVVGGLSVWALVRLREGLAIRGYQRNVKHLPAYVLRQEDIPWSKSRLFVGMGFAWEAKHTTRLFHLRHPRNSSYRQPGWLYRKARELEIAIEHTGFEPLTYLLRSPSRWNPVRPIPDVGGDPALHGVEPRERPIYLDLAERVGHTWVGGTTRVGKSVLLCNFVAQDIRRGDVVVVFDPKGDENIPRVMYAEARRAGREDQFYFFHLGFPQLSARYNPIGNFNRVTEIATRIANNMPSEGNSAAFKQFVWKFVNCIARACIGLGEKPSYMLLYRYAENPEGVVTRYLEHWLDHDSAATGWRDAIDSPEFDVDPKTVDRALKSRPVELVRLLMYIRSRDDLYDPVASGLINVVTYESSYFQKLVASLYPFLEKVTTGEVAELVSPDYDNLADTRPTFDWPTILANGGIVYLGFDTLEDQAVGAAVANAMLSDLTSQASKIYKHDLAFGQIESMPKRRLSLHADEMNELIGEEFIPMVNKAGGALYQVTAYTQTRADVEAKMGSAAKAQQVEGNFNTRVFLRVLSKHTAEMLTDVLPEVDIDALMDVSGVTDTNDPADFAEFGSKNEDRLARTRAPMLTPADLIQLPKGQAFVHTKGGQLYKVRIPIIDGASHEGMPADLETMVRTMGERYIRRATEGIEPTLTVEGKGVGF